jgi:hypothetical protein
MAKAVDRFGIIHVGKTQKDADAKAIEANQTYDVLTR